MIFIYFRKSKLKTVTMAARQIGRFVCQAGMRATAATRTPPQLGFTPFTKTSFSTSSPSQTHTFNVQDNEDFEERVIKSKMPVIVDFHAE